MKVIGVDSKRVGREKSSLDDYTLGVRLGDKTCQYGKRAGFMFIRDPIKCSRVGTIMYSRGRYVS